jgi:pimeloyl-ACP methyl ester carboxylesterase
MRYLFLTIAVLALANTGTAGEIEYLGGPESPAGTEIVIVHGIDPVIEKLEPLGSYFTSRGLDTHLFHYSTDQRLERSSRELAHAIRGIVARSSPQRVIVVGYSLGGLVARRALTADHDTRLAGDAVSFELITIASPLGGFRSANFWWIGLGLGKPLYRDLGSESPFIDEPGVLAPNVRHTKIETDESGALRLENGRWLDDEVVGVRAQRHSFVDGQAERIYRVEVGHTHIVNAYGNVHPRLADVLDDVIAAVTVERRASLH